MEKKTGVAGIIAVIMSIIAALCASGLFE